MTVSREPTLPSSMTERPHQTEGDGAEAGTTLADVYADLAAKQERLGPEFERVLHDNLWNLYARALPRSRVPG